MKAFVIFAALLFGSLVEAQAQTQWQLATGYRADTFHTRNLLQFADDIDKATAGALRIDIRPNNVLFKLAEIPQAVEDGRIQAGETIMTNLVDNMPLAGADTVPFVVRTYADALRMWELQRPLIEQNFKDRGMKALYAVSWPPQGLFSTTPVRTKADIAGKRMRTYNPATVRIAEMLGAQPVAVAMVDINKALAANQVDTMVTSAVTGVENQVWSKIHFYYDIDAWFPKNIVFVNQKAFDALAPAVQQAVMTASVQAEKRGWKMSQDVAAVSVVDLERNGIKVERAPADFSSEFRRIGERFSREWVHSVGHQANKIFIPYYFER